MLDEVWVLWLWFSVSETFLHRRIRFLRYLFHRRRRVRTWVKTKLIHTEPIFFNQIHFISKKLSIYYFNRCVLLTTAFGLFQTFATSISSSKRPTRILYCNFLTSLLFHLFKNIVNFCSIPYCRTPIFGVAFVNCGLLQRILYATGVWHRLNKNSFT